VDGVDEADGMDEASFAPLGLGEKRKRGGGVHAFRGLTPPG
jgi:hypothetical protein